MADSTNKTFFEGMHSAVLKLSLEQIDEEGKITTMRIASVEVDGKTYLLPTYDPDTKTVMDVSSDEGKQALVEKFSPLIEVGIITGYNSAEEAEADRESWYPALVENSEEIINEREEAKEKYYSTSEGKDDWVISPQEETPEEAEIPYAHRKWETDPDKRAEEKANQTLAFAEGGEVTKDREFSVQEKIAEALGLKPEDLDWATSVGKGYGVAGEEDGEGDAARHLALGWLASKTKNPELAKKAIDIRELIDIDPIKNPEATKMDWANNQSGYDIKAETKEDAEAQIKEMVKSKKAVFMSQKESHDMRGYKDGGEVKKDAGPKKLEAGIYQDDDGTLFQVTAKGEIKDLKNSLST